MSERTLLQAAIGRLIAERGLRPVFQPVLSLTEDRVVGFEALSRVGPSHGYEYPVDMARVFTDAGAVGRGTELELHAVSRALEHAGEVPAGAWLSVNVSPDALVTPAALELLLRPVECELVVELTEHAAVLDYAPLLAQVAELKAAGLRIAVDDAGAGHSSLRHILRIRPDLIKIDIDVTRGVHADPVRQALIHSLVTFARSIGAELLAEGVEEQAELDTLARIGVDLAQGYHLARPGPLPGPAVYPTVGPTGRQRDLGAMLAHVATAVTAATDAETLVRPLLDVVLEATGMETAYVTVYDEATQVLDHRFVLNTGPLQLPEGLAVPWTDTLCHRCRQLQIVWTADVPRELPGVPMAAGVRSFLSLPITTPDGQLFGTLCAGSTEHLFVGEDALLQLRMLARIVGQYGTAPAVAVAAVAAALPAAG